MSIRQSPARPAQREPVAFPAPGRTAGRAVEPVSTSRDTPAPRRGRRFPGRAHRDDVGTGRLRRRLRMGRPPRSGTRSRGILRPGCPGLDAPPSTASTSAASCAATPRCRSSRSPPAPRPRRRSPGWSWEPTTTSPSRSRDRSWWPGSPRCSAAPMGRSPAPDTGRRPRARPEWIRRLQGRLAAATVGHGVPAAGPAGG